MEEDKKRDEKEKKKPIMSAGQRAAAKAVTQNLVGSMKEWDEYLKKNGA